MRDHTIVSAPGKVLLAGGYLVLDPLYTGLVVATSSRFFASVKPTTEPCPSGTARVRVRAGQFPAEASTWTYTVTEAGVEGADTASAKNKFIFLTLDNVLRYVKEKLHRDGRDGDFERLMGGGLDIVVLADNDFYTQREQVSRARARRASARGRERRECGLGHEECAGAEARAWTVGPSRCMLSGTPTSPRRRSYHSQVEFFVYKPRAQTSSLRTPPVVDALTPARRRRPPCPPRVARLAHALLPPPAPDHADEQDRPRLLGRPRHLPRRRHPHAPRPRRHHRLRRRRHRPLARAGRPLPRAGQGRVGLRRRVSGVWHARVPPLLAVGARAHVRRV